MNDDCMGGWCAVRNTCARYRPGNYRWAADRLCSRGDRDQFMPKRRTWHMTDATAPTEVDGASTGQVDDAILQG